MSRRKLPRSMKARIGVAVFFAASCVLNVLDAFLYPENRVADTVFAALTGLAFISAVADLRRDWAERPSTPEDSQPYGVVAGDYLAPVAALTVWIGWSQVPYGSGWKWVFFVVAALAAFEAADRTRFYRRRSDEYRTALVELVRDYDRCDLYNREDALEYVPADALTEGRREVAP